MFAAGVGVVAGTDTGTSGNDKSGPETAAVDETKSLILLSNGRWQSLDGRRDTPHRNYESSAVRAVGQGLPQQP